MARELLRQIAPFRYLPHKTLELLATEVEPLVIQQGDWLYKTGDNDDRLFLLESGRVEVIDTSRQPEVVIDIIDGGHYFGDRPALFRELRKFSVRVLETGRAYVLKGARFLSLIAESPPFARVLADNLRSKQKLLVAFDQFLAQLSVGAALGELRLPEILKAYRALEPALHPKLNSAEIDFGALLYAVRRLPETTTSTFVFFLTDMLPSVWDSPYRTFDEVSSGVRPRTVYEVMPGKCMVLLRDATSDLVDLVTCLCVLCIEARKIRKRFKDPEQFLALAEWVAPKSVPQHIERAPQKGPPQIPLSDDEMTEFRRIWPDDTLQRLRDIVVHHEDYTLRVTKSRDTAIYHARHTERWAGQIAKATHALVGAFPRDLPEDLQVHIISSNTHSVTNCLSSHLASSSDQIMTWARDQSHKLLEGGWSNKTDLLYALSRDYFRKHAEEAMFRATADRQHGIMKLRETAFTGIQVELIDLTRIAGRRIDPALTVHEGKKQMIVNIDFAFGQQAGEILGALLVLFGPRVRSINVLGKAGALQGARGDLLVPTAFLEQSKDNLSLLGKQPLDLNRLAAQVPGRTLHTGPMLTVAGTLLQNRMMLHFYHQIWRCIGLEMEGAYYYQRAQEALQLGLISPDVKQRYLYYVSDLPLDTESNLSEALSVHEGIPPLYAITREILSEVLND